MGVGRLGKTVLTIMTEKFLCIIQARVGSTRLPGKVLLKVGGITMLEYLLKRVKRSKKIDKIVVATSRRRSNDKIEKVCKKMKVDCFRGSENDALDRYYKCFLKYPQHQYIIRLTADNPLIDPAVIDKVITFFKQHQEYDYVCNNLVKTFPCGMDLEIFKKSALIESAKKSKSLFEREHVDEYVLRRKKFKKGNVSAGRDFSNFRLTLDYPEDFEVIKFLIEKSKPTDGYLRYVSLLIRNPRVMLKNINYNVENSLLKHRSLSKKKFNFARGGNQETIVVLGGALVKDRCGHWRTTNYYEGDNFGICGSRLRVIAAGFLYKDNQRQSVIVSGGKGQLKDVLPGKITLASVIKEELVRIGIPAKNIIKEEKSGNTYQQLKELQKIIKTGVFKNIIIISNKYHLPRLRAMIKYAGDLRVLKKMFNLSKLKIKSAEEIAIKYKPKIWGGIIGRIYKSRELKERIKSEKQGAEQIKNGTYQLK